jgi:rhamnogalacturonyl hydrolase YesR
MKNRVDMSRNIFVFTNKVKLLIYKIPIQVMKKKIVSLLSAALLLSSCTTTPKDQYAWVERAIETAEYQLKMMASQVDELRADSALFPRSIRNGKVRLEGPKDWTSGFFPGALWYGYELTGDKTLQEEAWKYTDLLKPIQYYTGNHDVGFMMYCSYGNARRLASKAGDDTILVNTAQSLITRYNPTVKSIRSWDFGEWSYPVIIDNMMNLELLFWASEHAGNPVFRDVAIAHANTTLKHHFRSDMSSYHVVSYNPQNGEVESQGTFQGYSDDSAWARGQAWGLYGYVMTYRFARDNSYLECAEAIANYIMNHPNTPKDLIPYWDYNAPNIPNEPRDASAAAIIASALLELSELAPNGKPYFEYAEKILKSLSSDAYLAKKGENKGFILMHSVGHLPANSEIDTPLVYADYYYLEALKRYLDIVK